MKKVFGPATTERKRISKFLAERELEQGLTSFLPLWRETSGEARDDEVDVGVVCLWLVAVGDNTQPQGYGKDPTTGSR